jgi:hypothetical protein
MSENEPNNDDAQTTTARVHHVRFMERDSLLGQDTSDLKMGYEFATDEVGIEVEDVWERGGYERDVGEVEVATREIHPDDDRAEIIAGRAYQAWEEGRGHDPRETRSMSVGDIIEVEGVAYFVDTVGFVELDDLTLDDENDEDEVEEGDVIERLGREFRVVEVVDEDDYEVEPVA